jgi:hypothetical protein
MLVEGRPAWRRWTGNADAELDHGHEGYTLDRLNSENRIFIDREGKNEIHRSDTD